MKLPGDESAVMETIAMRADALETWLWTNAGTNADWPVRITTDNEDDSGRLVELLTDLRKALEPFRLRNGKRLTPTESRR